MIITKTKLKGAYIIDIERLQDDRGFFGRTYCQREFEKQGIDFNIVQSNVSFNKKKGTLRGLHAQVAPYREAKFIRCISGAIYDVIVDMRRNSYTYMQWIATELRADNFRMLYIPEGFAHGFITLEDNTEVMYDMSEFYTPGSEMGICWNDPAFNIQWPIMPVLISEKDKSYPLLQQAGIDSFLHQPH